MCSFAYKVVFPVRTLIHLATFSLVAFSWSTNINARRLPNIILILADDLGYGEVGCYGQQIIQTPNIDRLAAQGIRFTQHYCGSPVCAPSRCVLLTGLHGGHAFIRNNREHKPEGQLPIPDDTVTVAELLKGRGYATAAIGKWGLGYPGSSGDPNKQGFDLFYGYNCQRHAHNHYPRYLWQNDERIFLGGNTRELNGLQHSQDLFTREALKFIRDHRQKPFFLYLPFAIPHLSIQVPASSLAEYQGKVREHDYKHKGYLQHPFPHAGYAAMVSHMDRAIGNILDLLDRLNLGGNTLVMFTSDNGPTFARLGGADSDFFASAGPLRGRKGSVYEGGIRIPLVARWAGKIEEGQVSDHISAFQDILPTLIECADGNVPPNIDGISFLPELLGEQQQPHAQLVWHFTGYGGQQAVRKGRWKAVRRDILKIRRQTEVTTSDRVADKATQSVSSQVAAIQLYDLSIDIAESNDIAQEHPEVVQEMEEILTKSQNPSEHFPQL